MLELQFQNTPGTCLAPVLREVQNTELTQELKLSDGMPDVGRVLGAWAQVILRGKQWRADSVGCSGGLMVWVLYAPEEGPERVLEGWIPFQMNWDLPADTPEGKLRVTCLPRFVDARSVSPRRIMVRSGVAALAEAYGPKTFQTYTPGEMPEKVELLTSSYPLRLGKEAGEKAFLLDEDLELPEDHPQLEKLVYFTINPKITDKKVLSGKIVFRGTGNLHMLYRSPEGELATWEAELPFSQFGELDGEYGADAQADFATAITSAELEPAGEGHLHLKCGLVSQYRITDRELLSMVEDAYSPGRNLELRQEELELPVILENHRENLYGEEKITVEAADVTDLCFLPDFPRQRRMEDGVALEVPGVFQMLYRAQDGSLQSSGTRWEGKHKIRCDEHTDLTAMPRSAETLTASPAGDMVSLKMELPMEWTATADQRFSQVTGVALGEEQTPNPDRPSLILRRAGKDRLWDIAKESGSTMAAIREANGLEEEPAPNQMLLIPVS